MSKSKIKAIIFDLDGTILDTDQMIWAGYRYVFAKYRPEYQLSESELLEVLGPPLKDIFPKYFTQEVDVLVNDYRQYCQTLQAKDYVSLCPGALQTIQYLKKHGYKLGIVTTKFVQGAIVSLKDFGLDQYFDVIVGLDSVQHHKPHPEGVIKILNQLNVQSHEAILVGDNATDILAGKGAGVVSIGIGWSKKGTSHLLKAHPYTIIDDMYKLIDIIKEIDQNG